MMYPAINIAFPGSYNASEVYCSWLHLQATITGEVPDQLEWTLGNAQAAAAAARPASGEAQQAAART